MRKKKGRKLGGHTSTVEGKMDSFVSKSSLIDKLTSCQALVKLNPFVLSSLKCESPSPKSQQLLLFVRFFFFLLC